MALTITDTVIRSDQTTHTALRSKSGRWHVSWLPGRTVDRNQAITAITLAEVVGARGVRLPGDPIWPFLDNWAAELGLSGPQAVVLASEPPGNETP